MIVERRIVAGLKDLKAVILECGKCRARISRSPDNPGEIPCGCPSNCGQVWRTDTKSQRAESFPVTDYIRFWEAIATIRKMDAEHPLGFSILFELEEPQ